MTPIYGCLPMSLEGSWVKSWLLWIDDDKKSLRTMTDSYKWQSEVQIRGPLENPDFSRTWVALFLFHGRHIKVQTGFWGKNNFVVCQNLSIFLFEYFASKKHFTPSFMSHCFEGIDWCMLEGGTQKWTKQGNYPGNNHDLLWQIGHCDIGRGARKHGRTAVHHNLEILNAGAHMVLCKSRKHVW